METSFRIFFFKYLKNMTLIWNLDIFFTINMHFCRCISRLPTYLSHLARALLTGATTRRLFRRQRGATKCIGGSFLTSYLVEQWVFAGIPKNVIISQESTDCFFNAIHNIVFHRSKKVSNDSKRRGRAGVGGVVLIFFSVVT